MGTPDDRRAPQDGAGRTADEAWLDVAGGDAGLAPMTWGQLHIWRPLQWFGAESNSFNLRKVLPLAEPVTEAAALAALRRLILEHQVLRSHYTPASEETGRRRPTQEVFGAGAFPVRFVDCDAEDVAAAAARCTADLAEAPFHLESEWAARFGLIRTGGRVVALALAVSHVAVDGWSLERLLEDAAALFAGGTPAPSLQPLEQATYEASEAGRAADARAMRHWRSQLEPAPPTVFATAGGSPDDPPYQRWRLRSEAVASAAALLAARTGTAASSVLLTVGAAALAEVSGRDAVGIQLIAGNRYTPRQRRLLAAAAQDALYLYQSIDEDFSDTARRVHQGSNGSYMTGQYDPESLAALKDETAGQVGHRSELSAYFNDSRIGKTWSVPPPGEDTPEYLDRLREKSELELTAGFPKHDMAFMVAVGQDAELCNLSLLADTRHVDAAGCRAVLLGIEAALCRAVAADAPLRTLLGGLPGGRS